MGEIDKNFDGQTFDQAQDGKRLKRQLDRVREFMSDGKWHTLPEIYAKVPGLTTSLSARLRDLRNKEGYTVDRRRRSKGLHEYRVLKPQFAESLW